MGISGKILEQFAIGPLLQLSPLKYFYTNTSINLLLTGYCKQSVSSIRNSCHKITFFKVLF